MLNFYGFEGLEKERDFELLFGILVWIKIANF
jgi:hypothetical protein